MSWPVLDRTIADHHVSAGTLHKNPIERLSHPNEGVIIEIDGYIVTGDRNAVGIATPGEGPGQPNGGGPRNKLRQLAQQKIQLVATDDYVVGCIVADGVVGHVVPRAIDA